MEDEEAERCTSGTAAGVVYMFIGADLGLDCIGGGIITGTGLEGTGVGGALGMKPGGRDCTCLIGPPAGALDMDPIDGNRPIEGEFGTVGITGSGAGNSTSDVIGDSIPRICSGGERLAEEGPD